MPRSTRDSEDEGESKTGRKTRTLITQVAVDSPVRRSSRIKQFVKQNKLSPESTDDASDTSTISNNQSTRITRQRAGTMDSIATETLKGHTTKTSISSDISEIIEIDITGTPKRTTRSSLILINTPTKTRASSKRLTRAGSETKSPPLVTRNTRRIRASSVDPGAMSNQNKSQSSTPIKTRRRASIAPSNSPVKEEVEKCNTLCLQLDETLIEVDESSSGNSNISPNKALHSQQSREIGDKDESINKDKVEEDSNYDEVVRLSEKEKVSNKYVITTQANSEKNLVEERRNSAENLLSDVNTADEVSIHDTSSPKYIKESKAETIGNEKNLIETEQSITEKYKKSPVKELGIKIENLLNISVTEQKNSPCNKENQTSNIININEILEKSVGPVISNVMSMSTKTLNLISTNKSLNEKETKSVKNESNLSKRRHSKELTESTVKHNPSKENTDNIQEKVTDISTNSPSSSVIHEKRYLDSPLVDNTNKKSSLIDETNNNLETIGNKPVLLQDDAKVADKIAIKSKVPIEDPNKSNENATKMADESDRNVKTKHITVDETSEIYKTENISNSSKENIDNIQKKITDTTTDSTNFSSSNIINEKKYLNSPLVNNTNKRSSCSQEILSTLIDDEMVIDDENNKERLILKEQNVCQDDKSFDNSMKTASSNFNLSETEIETSKIRSDKSITIDEQVHTTQNDADDLSDSTKETEKNVTELTSESSNNLEVINSTSNDSNADIQDSQSSDFAKVSEESSVNISFTKVDSMNTSLNVIKQKNTKTLNPETEEKNMQLEKSREEPEDIDSIDNDSEINMNNLFQDIPIDKLKEKTIQKFDDENSVDKMDNESECDLVLVDKQAWLAAESMKMAKKKECFDYDSDDTVVLKSRLDAIQDSNNIKKLQTIEEGLQIDIDSEENEVIKPTKTRKSLIKKRSKKDKNSSTGYIEDTDSLSSADKSLNKSVTMLNRSGNESFKLSTSKQTTETGRHSRIHDESDEEIADDTDGSNKSSQESKDISSASERKSSIKFSKYTSLEQNDQSMKNISVNEADDSKEMDNTNIKIKKNLKRKRSLDESGMHNKDADNDVNQYGNEESSLSKDDSAIVKCLMDEKLQPEDSNTSIQLNINDFNENDSTTVIQNKDSGSKKKKINHSTIVHVGSTSNESNDDDSSSEREIPGFLYAISDDNDDDDDDEGENDESGDGSSIDSDVKKEYNLSGKKRKFSDDDIPGDECRASESEYSDPDDNGSDLADFIIDNNEEIEDEEEVEEEQYEEQDEEEEVRGQDEGEVKEQDEEEEVKEQDEEEENDEEKEKNDEKNEQNIEKDEDSEQEDIKENNLAYKKEDIDEELSVEQETNATRSHNKINESLKIHKNKNLHTESMPNIIQVKRKDVKANKFHMKENEETILLDASNLSSTNKKKSDVQCSSKDVIEQKRLNEFEITLKRKLSKLDLSESLESSTPKRINKEKTLLHTSLPSDLLEISGKTISSKPTSKLAKLHKTMNLTHTETPTIRHLRKEKLNESAPELKLSTGSSQLKKYPEKDLIIQTEIMEKDSEEEVPNITMPSNDNETQKPSKKQKKRKKQAQDTSDKYIIHEDTMETNVSKNKARKRDKLSKIPIIKDDIIKDCEYTGQIYEKKKKKKKQKEEKISVTEKDKNVNEDNIRKDICETKTELAQHRKKKNQIETILKRDTADNRMIMKRKAKQQDIVETKEISPPLKSPEKKKKKKSRKEEETSLSQIKVSKTKSEVSKKKESEKLRLRNIIVSSTDESKNIAFAKARNEALEAIKCATTRIKLSAELKKKSKQKDINTKLQKQDMISAKQQKKDTERQMLSAYTGDLIRLPDDVIENLTDVPMRKKKQKRNEEQIMPSLSMSTSKFTESEMRDNSFIPLSSHGSTTQFAIVNLQKAKKQSKISTSAKSYKQQMLAKNNRHPMSSYLMYLQKRRATSGFNEFEL